MRRREHDPALGRELPQRAPSTASRSRVLRGPRLVEQEESGVAWRAVGGSRGRSRRAAPDRPTGRRRPGRAGWRGRARRPPGGAHGRARVGSASSSPRRTFDAIVPARSDGACPDQAIDERSPGTGVDRRGALLPRRRANPSRAAKRLDLPDPLSPSRRRPRPAARRSGTRRVPCGAPSHVEAG